MIQRTACLLGKTYDPYRNQAIEQVLLQKIPQNTAFLFLWQDQHSIVIGQNQNPWSECKVKDFIRSGGLIAKRQSGGSAVYHDLGRLNYTLIVPKSDFDIPRQLHVVSQAISQFGISVIPSGRSALSLNGRIFSESTFFKAGNISYHHGTIPIDVNLNNVAHYLTPPTPETPNNADHAINLKQLNHSITIQQMQIALFNSFYNIYGVLPTWIDETMLEKHTIEKIRSNFSKNSYIFPEIKPFTFSVSEHFLWGNVSIQFSCEDGIIRNPKLFSDAIEAPLFPMIEQLLIGCPFLIGAIEKRFTQKRIEIGQSDLTLILEDICNLICGHIRSSDRDGHSFPILSENKP